MFWGQQRTTRVFVKKQKPIKSYFWYYLQTKTGRIIKKKKLVFNDKNNKSIDLSDSKILEVLNRLKDLSKKNRQK